jgi:hypothetical protein
LKVGINDLTLVAKKKVTAAAASVSSIEAFPTVGLALQLEVPMVVAASTWLEGQGEEECWNSSLDASIQLEAVVVATSEAAQLWETLPTTSQVLDPYENHVAWKFDSCMSKNLNSKLKKEENCTCDPSKRGVKGSPGALGHGTYGERPADCTNYINHLLSN